MFLDGVHLLLKANNLGLTRARSDPASGQAR